MENMPKVQVVFYITGTDFEPEDITEILKIKPSSFKSMKEFPVKEYAKSFWALITDKEQVYKISGVFQQLVDFLEKKEEIIKKVVAKFGCETRFTVNIWIEDGERPEMVLNRETLSFVNRLDADIAFDLFFD